MDLTQATDDELRDELAKRAGAPVCYYCGALAAYFCDELVFHAGRLAIPHRLCSQPLCAIHRIEIGKSFDLYGPGVVETIDRCPDCQDAENARNAPKPGPGGGGRARKAA
jgi:hypothetical protein